MADAVDLKSPRNAQKTPDFQGFFCLSTVYLQLVDELIRDGFSVAHLVQSAGCGGTGGIGKSPSQLTWYFVPDSARANFSSAVTNGTDN